MKNTMKLLLCLMLVICMALSMVACGDSEEKDTEEKKEAESTQASTEEISEEDTEEVSEEDTEEDTEEAIAGDSLAGYYSAVLMIPSAEMETIVMSFVEAMECYDVEYTDLTTDELNFGICYYVDATDDTMNFTYDYESTQYVFDSFKEGLAAVLKEALELEAEYASVTWEDMEQACQDKNGMDVDTYIATLLNAFETNLDLANQDDQVSTYTAADGIITVDGTDYDYIVDGDEVYISYEDELIIYMIAE